MRCQVYIGTGPDPEDVYCMEYVSSAAERLLIIITSVVVVSCLIFVVAVVVVCCRDRRRRRTSGAAAAAAAAVSGDGRYVEQNGDERLSASHSNIGGNVRMNIRRQSNDNGDHSGEIRWVVNHLE